MSGTGSGKRPALAEVPPLKPVTRTSVIVTPAAIALDGHPRRHGGAGAARPHRQARQSSCRSCCRTPRSAGPSSAVRSRSPAGRRRWSCRRVLNGTLRATGQIAAQAGGLTGAIGGLLGERLGQDLQSLTGKTLDQRADIRGNVTVTARPALLPAWRLEPNLTGQVSIADASLSILGVKLSVSNEVQAAARSHGQRAGRGAAGAPARRSVPRSRRAARMGQDVPLDPDRRGGGRACRISGSRCGRRAPSPAQPRIDAVRASRSRSACRPKPGSCPPRPSRTARSRRRLEIVPQIEQGRVNIAVPIDVPFTEVNRLLEAQLKGKTFPQDKSGAFAVTVRGVSAGGVGRAAADLAARPGQREQELVRSRRRGDRACVGQARARSRPAGAAPRRRRARRRVGGGVRAAGRGGPRRGAVSGSGAGRECSGRPEAVRANARKSIEAAIADFRKSGDGVRVDAAVTALRLVGIEFDAKTLRVIAEADGTARVAVTALP